MENVVSLFPGGTNHFFRSLSQSSPSVFIYSFSMYSELRKTLTTLVGGLLSVLVQGEQNSETVMSIINSRTKLGARIMTSRTFGHNKIHDTLPQRAVITVFKYGCSQVSTWRTLTVFFRETQITFSDPCPRVLRVFFSHLSRCILN